MTQGLKKSKGELIAVNVNRIMKLLFLLLTNVCISQTYLYSEVETRVNDKTWKTEMTHGTVIVNTSSITIDEVNGFLKYYEILSTQRLIKKDFFIYSCSYNDEIYQLVMTDWDKSGKYITLLIYSSGAYKKYCLTKL